MKENVSGLGHVARQGFCMGTLEDMIDPILKDEIGENNFVLTRGPNKDSLHTFMKIAYQCVAETQDQRPTMKVVVKELEKALSFQLNSEVKSDYVEEKSDASIIETQVVELSNEVNNMNMTGESENFKIHNKENMLHDQTDDPAEPDCLQESLLGRLLHLLGQICQKQMHKYEKEAKLQVLLVVVFGLSYWMWDSTHPCKFCDKKQTFPAQDEVCDVNRDFGAVEFSKVDTHVLRTVLLIARPNVGKSALFNRLAILIYVFYCYIIGELAGESDMLANLPKQILVKR
ncbi:hypothetical protein HanIR_Chr11g0558531 [Helianthus annuus]|nr:hypothetical protein HanIR_Chr11g0558531 [Helianthus annuus]